MTVMISVVVSLVFETATSCKWDEVLTRVSRHRDSTSARDRCLHSRDSSLVPSLEKYVLQFKNCMFWLLLAVSWSSVFFYTGIVK